MTIVKRGKDAWQVRIFLGRDQNGRTQFFNETVKGKRKDAERFENNKKRELELGIAVQHAKVSLNEYLDKWFKISAGPRLRERTYEDYVEYMRRYVRPSLGEKRLDKIRPLDIQSVYSRMLGAGLSARTVCYTHAILSSALKQAVKWQLMGINPAASVDLPKRQKTEMRALSPDEAVRFLKAASHNELFALFSLALSTGMRPEEYLGLKWKDIDLVLGYVTIQRALVWKRKGGGWSLQEPKTPLSRRRLPISNSVVDQLKSHRREQLKDRLSLGSSYVNHDFVFATKIGTPLLASNLTRRHFKPLLERAGLSQSIRLYDLRHSCATLLLSQGVSPKVIAERLGHSTIVLTLDTYSHVLPSMQKDATEQLEEILFRSASTGH